MGEKVIIFGDTEMAEMAQFYFAHDSSYDVVAFTVDGAYMRETTFRGLPVVPFEEVIDLYPPDEVKGFVALWFGKVNKTRADKYLQMKEAGYCLVSYVSSQALTAPDLVVGDNTFIFNGGRIGPFCRVGNNVILGGCSVGHHAVIGDHCFVADRSVLLGLVTVEPYCFIGANSTILERVVVARECIIGAGVTLGRSTKEREVYISQPPKLLPKPSTSLASWLTWPVR